MVAPADHDCFELTSGGNIYGPYVCGTYSKKLAKKAAQFPSSSPLLNHCEVSFNTQTGHTVLDDWDIDITFFDKDVDYRWQIRPSNLGQDWLDLITGQIALSNNIGTDISDTQQILYEFASGEDYVPLMARLQVKSTNYSGEVTMTLDEEGAYLRGVGAL